MLFNVNNMIHETVREKRRKLEMSQETLAGLAGTNRTSIVNFENGRSGVSSKTLERIFKALDINLNTE